MRLVVQSVSVTAHHRHLQQVSCRVASVRVLGITTRLVPIEPGSQFSREMNVLAAELR